MWSVCVCVCVAVSGRLLCGCGCSAPRARLFFFADWHWVACVCLTDRWTVFFFFLGWVLPPSGSSCVTHPRPATRDPGSGGLGI